MSPLRGMTGMGGGASSSQFALMPEPAGFPAFNWRYHAYGSSINDGDTRVYWRTSGGTMNLLRSVAGQQHTSFTATWNTYSEDLSSYSGTTGRIYIAYETGNNFYNDPAFDNMELVDTTSGTIDLDPGTTTGRARWERGSGYVNSGATDIPTGSWTTVTISTSTGNMWNYDSGGTPSSSTGPSRDADGSSSGYYLYFEGSSPNYWTGTASNRYYWVRMKSDYTLL